MARYDTAVTEVVPAEIIDLCLPEHSFPSTSEIKRLLGIYRAGEHKVGIDPSDPALLLHQLQSITLDWDTASLSVLGFSQGCLSSIEINISPSQSPYLHLPSSGTQR